MNRHSAYTKRQILIVDDSEMNRMLLSDILSDDFEILEASNGIDALAILNSQRAEISIILLDLVMPKMNGFELLEIMNENNWIQTIPVVMISSEGSPEFIDKAYDLGIYDYISRPFDERIVKRRVNSTIMLAAKQKDLSNMVARQIYENEKDSRLMIEILSHIVEFRNGESGLHVLHVRTLTDLILKRLMEKTDKYLITPKDISMICNASALHDIGKIAIPEEILNKPGKLTDEEFEIMKTHTTQGAELLHNIPLRDTEPLIKIAYQICRWHHERYDGNGYPDGLKGDDIPIAAQIVALADVYDALTSKRVYKDGYPHKKAIEMIMNGECGVFNPLLLECLKDISSVLERNLNLIADDYNSQIGVLSTVERMMKENDLGISDSTLHMLQQEREKNQFFASLSQEIQFEYGTVPERITFSEWSAKYLGLPETIINPQESILGNGIFEKEDFKDFVGKMKSTTHEHPIIEERYLLNINGEKRWTRIILKSTWEENGENCFEFSGAIGKMIDINDEMEKIQNLENMALKDSLTGLLNHRTAKYQISSILKHDNERTYALMLFDLDNFKQANDTRGHLFGDEVLKYVADTVKSCIRSSDIASRMGGDEFMIFAEYKNVLEPQVKRIFNKLTCDFKGFKIGISMGIAKTENCGEDYEKLFKMADDAMYAAKSEGKRTYKFSDDIKTDN